MHHPTIDAETLSSRRSLYRLGGAAALLAGVLFRRNLGMEVALLSSQPQPDTVLGAFTLLQDHRLLGLTYLSVFDLVNYILVATMLVTLYALLRRVSEGYAAAGALLGLGGIVVYCASNMALSMLALSGRYAAATTDAERAALAAAGQALMAVHRFGQGAHPGAGGYLSLLLVALAGLLMSVPMLRSGLFGRATPYVGILANGLDLAYCLAYLLAPPTAAALLAVSLIPAAGLLFMVWHILVGWRLYRLGRDAVGADPALSPG